MYNGQIYNSNRIADARCYASDGECLIPAYQKYGVTFARELDGEFAIVLLDFRQNIVLIATDPFATKPLWYAISGRQIGVASYKSSLTGIGFHDRDTTKVPPNQTLVFDLASLEIVARSINFMFDIEDQSKDEFADWFQAFENAVRKRTTTVRERVFIGLSSGYDSGALACVMEKFCIPFQAYSILARENRDLLRQRHLRLNNGRLVEFSVQKYVEAQTYLKKFCEEFQYQIYRDGTLTPDEYLTDDQGAVGLAYICSLAKADGCRIYLSGQGADEILADYGHNGTKKYNHSSFGGRFPDVLSDVFPWRSFFFGTQISYLCKEEHVAGSYGLEGRYPYLDKALVQEFLWLSPRLKNLHYKAPLHEYLSRQNYPFALGEKIGFSSAYNLQ
jgi:asparagine synthetase B (glutamine-hydrolysing)